MIRKTLALAAVSLLGFATPALAISYNSQAEKDVLHWSDNHHPGWAKRVSVGCYSVGRNATCTATFTGGGSMCEYTVKVSASYAIRKTDSNC